MVRLLCRISDKGDFAVKSPKVCFFSSDTRLSCSRWRGHCASRHCISLGSCRRLGYTDFGSLLIHHSSLIVNRSANSYWGTMAGSRELWRRRFCYLCLLMVVGHFILASAQTVTTGWWYVSRFGSNNCWCILPYQSINVLPCKVAYIICKLCPLWCNPKLCLVLCSVNAM